MQSKLRRPASHNKAVRTAGTTHLLQCQAGVRWGTFLSVLLWNTSGYDSVGALAAEVQLCSSARRDSSMHARGGGR